MLKKKILARLQQIKASCTSILDAADADSGKLSDEQTAEFDALMAESEKLNADLERVEKLESVSASTRTVPAPQPTAQPRVEVGAPVIESDPMRGFETVSEFGRAVMQAALPGGRVDDRLHAIRRMDTDIVAAPTNYMTEHNSSDGYMVPPQVSDEVSKLVMGGEGLLERFSPEVTTSNSVEELFDESTPWGSSGVLAYWSEEGAQLTGSRTSQRKSRTTLHKLHALVLASDELLEDTPRLQNRLTVAAADAIRWKAEDAIVNGNGVGKPQGFHQADCLVSVAKEASQAADTIDDQNILKAYSRLFGGTEGAFWLAHRNTVPQLAAMTIGDQPMWLGPSGNLSGAPGGMLLGLPVVFSEHAQTLGDAGDIQLVQPKGYAAYIKGGVKFSMSMHLYFDYDIGAFKWTFRIGGQAKLSAAVTMNQSDTASHFIDIAARA